jgi:hypothetical protein
MYKRLWVSKRLVGEELPRRISLLTGLAYDQAEKRQHLIAGRAA